jgi:hypothetical protein
MRWDRQLHVLPFFHEGHERRLKGIFRSVFIAQNAPANSENHRTVAMKATLDALDIAVIDRSWQASTSLAELRPDDIPASPGLINQHQSAAPTPLGCFRRAKVKLAHLDGGSAGDDGLAPPGQCLF